MVMVTVCLQRPILLKDIVLTFIKTAINSYLVKYEIIVFKFMRIINYSFFDNYSFFYLFFFSQHLYTEVLRFMRSKPVLSMMILRFYTQADDWFIFSFL